MCIGVKILLISFDPILPFDSCPKNIMKMQEKVVPGESVVRLFMTTKCVRDPNGPETMIHCAKTLSPPVSDNH